LPCNYSPLIRQQPPLPPLFPYTTLFRSALRRKDESQRADQRGKNEQMVVLGILQRGGELRAETVDGFEPSRPRAAAGRKACAEQDRKSTRLNSSHQIISYAVFCLKKKK